MIKKWATKGTEPDGKDSYFKTKRDAIYKAHAIIVLGLKDEVRVARFSETLFHKGASLRACYNVIGTLKPNKNGIIRMVKA